jgi:hypothetical protein
VPRGRLPRERDAWAPHTQTHHTNARCAAMMIRPYKPRDSARSALLTAVRVADVRRSGLAVHPRRVLTTYTALRRDSAMPGPLTPRSYLIYLLTCDKIDRISYLSYLSYLASARKSSLHAAPFPARLTVWGFRVSEGIHDAPNSIGHGPR